MVPSGKPGLRVRPPAARSMQRAGRTTRTVSSLDDSSPELKRGRKVMDFIPVKGTEQVECQRLQWCDWNLKTRRPAPQVPVTSDPTRGPTPRHKDIPYSWESPPPDWPPRWERWRGQERLTQRRLRRKLQEPELHLGTRERPEAELHLETRERPEAELRLGTRERPEAELHLGTRERPEAELRLGNREKPEAELRLGNRERPEGELRLETGERPVTELHLGTRDGPVAELRLGTRERPEAEFRLGARQREAMEHRRLREVQQARRRRMAEACLRYREAGGPRLLAPHHVARIYVEDRYRLLYCEVPKAGCSNWKRVLMVLGGQAGSTAHIQHKAAHYSNSLRRLDSFDRDQMWLRLRTYTKLLFVREPIERLVSAFRDKFEQPNTYYHPVFGTAIIARYRPNATQEALSTGSGVTFPEFVHYLLDSSRPVGMDIHWEPVSRLCSPCLVHYDFIGHFESLESEADSVLRLIGAPRNLTYPRFKDRHSQEERTSSRISRQYLAQLPPGDQRSIFHFYQSDYTMFNYPKPETIIN
ncbi:carbohydrate sulfotransferase 8-like [Mustelus asterias]